MALQFPPEFPFHRNAEPAASEPPSDAASASAESCVDEPTPSAASVAAVRRRSIPQLATMPAVSAGSDRRRSPRQTLVAKATIRPDTTVSVPSLTTAGFVSNISMNGVGFHTKKPLAVGEKYRITLELGPMKWSSRLRVVTCRHHDESETFDVGAEFVGNELNRLAA